MSNLVDSMMMEMQSKNSAEDMDYHPPMNGGDVRMGEVVYEPNIGATRGGGASPEVQMPVQQTADEYPPDMDVPDLNEYGMNEGDTQSTWEKIFMEIKVPLIVVALAFLMTIPMFNATIRNVLSNVTTNLLYVNILQSLLIGVLFYILVRLLI